KLITSALPSPLKSPMPGNSALTLNQSFHLPPPLKAVPVENATYTSPSAALAPVPRRKVNTSALPSPLTSPTAGTSLFTQNHVLQVCPAPKFVPVESATNT